MSLDARKIRSIYEAIDTGSYKLAVQTCNKLLKKHPDIPLLKALKSLSLLRSTKIEEAIALCDEVLAVKPSDEETVTALMHVLRQLERHEDIITLYEEAYKKQPLNEEMGAQAFMAMIRIGSWKTAQQISMKMSKTFKDARLPWWNIMSTFLQATDLMTPEATRGVLLSLAERLIQANPNPSWMTPDKLHLHLSILLAKKPPAYQEAYDLLQNEQAKRRADMNLNVAELRRDLWQHLGKWKDEQAWCLEQLEAGDRNWLTFVSLLDSTFRLIHDPSEGADNSAVEGEAVDHISNLRALFTELAEKDGRKERAAHLALIELEDRLLSRDDLKQHCNLPNGLVSLYKSYWETFSDKPSCFADLEYFIRGHRRAPTASELEELVGFLEAVPHSVETLADLQRSINAQKLLRFCRPAPTSASDEVAEACKLFNYYIDGLPLGKDLPDKELQPADDFALLAANALLSAWTLSADHSHLTQCLCLLEYAVAKTTKHYQMRILLIRIYRLLGAHSQAMVHYRALEVKQVQLDTLSYLVLARCPTFSLAANGDLGLISECLETSRIYQDNAIETADMLTKAFQYEKYSQINEFIEFEDRLDSSLQRDLIKLDHVRMRFVLEPPTAETAPIELQELDFVLYKKDHHDNRDFDLFPDYRSHASSADLKSQTNMGPQPGVKWFMTFARVYMRAINRHVDPSFHSDDLESISEDDLSELTAHEKSFIRLTHILAEWMWPTDKPRPGTDEFNAALEAAKATAAAASKAGANGSANGTTKPAASKEEHPKTISTGPHIRPDVPGTPEAVLEVFENYEKKLKELLDDKLILPWELLHIVSMAHEALVLLGVHAYKFLNPTPNSSGKPKKADPIVPSIKQTRQKASAIVNSLGSALIAHAETHGSVEKRKELTSSCAALTDKITAIDQEFVSGVVKKLVDSRKAMFEGMGKGIHRVLPKSSPA